MVPQKTNKSRRKAILSFLALISFTLHVAFFLCSFCSCSPSFPPSLHSLDAETSSLFVADGILNVDTSSPFADAYNENRESTANWDALPKDVKMYLFGFMPLEDFVSMSQVSRSWNKAAKKHPKGLEAARREETFEREKIERERYVFCGWNCESFSGGCF